MDARLDALEEKMEHIKLVQEQSHTDLKVIQDQVTKSLGIIDDLKEIPMEYMIRKGLTPPSVSNDLTEPLQDTIAM